MTVVVEYKGSKKQEEVKDVINFYQDTNHFWLKLKNDGARTYFRRNVGLVRIYDKEIKEKHITELEKENAELKEVHESDKRSLALIAKKGADFEKAYNEAEELLDKQIEATYKLFEENKELKADNKALREKVHWWKKEVNVAHRARADEFEKLVIENKVLKRKLTYAKTIIQDLLDNTDEYARQRAEDFLKENK